MDYNFNDARRDIFADPKFVYDDNDSSVVMLFYLRLMISSVGFFIQPTGAILYNLPITGELTMLNLDYEHIDPNDVIPEQFMMNKRYLVIPHITHYYTSTSLTRRQQFMQELQKVPYDLAEFVEWVGRQEQEGHISLIVIDVKNGTVKLVDTNGGPFWIDDSDFDELILYIKNVMPQFSTFTFSRYCPFFVYYLYIFRPYDVPHIGVCLPSAFVMVSWMIEGKDPYEELENMYYNHGVNPFQYVIYLARDTMCRFYFERVLGTTNRDKKTYKQLLEDSDNIHRKAVESLKKMIPSGLGLLHDVE